MDRGLQGHAAQKSLIWELVISGSMIQVEQYVNVEWTVQWCSDLLAGYKYQGVLPVYFLAKDTS